MEWTVELTVKYVPCPAEHAPAWWEAMRVLREMTMQINPDHRGRTADGRATYRPLIQLSEDDYPPESKYWMNVAQQAAKRLAGRMGYEPYCAWIDAQEEPAHWRGLYELVRAKEQELEGGVSQAQDSTTREARA